MTADTPAPEPLGQRADVVIDTLLGWLTGPDSGQNDGIMAAVNLVRELAAANAALELRLAGAQDGLDIAAEAMGARIAALTTERDAALASAERLEEALRFYADPNNWRDTPSWDGDPDCITPKAIPVDRTQDGSPCDCGDIARAALATEPPMAAPISSHQHGGENARQQGGEEGIAPFSPPDTLAPEPPQ